jgi:uncharacterized membrane protein (UPF0127 family)
MFNALTLALVLFSPAPMPTPQSLPVIVLHAPRATLHVQVAKTSPQRERGLMGVTRLRPRAGMLFIFERDEPVAFWMKDTLIPLDMVFISSGGVVRAVYRNVAVVSPALPDGEIPLEQGVARYVIELPANEALLDGIRTGTRFHGLPR